MSSKNDSKTNPASIDLHALDAVLDAFAVATQDLSTPRNELYENFHRRMVACTDSLAVAVFSKSKESQFAMVSHVGWRKLDGQSLASVKASIKHYYLQKDSPFPASRVSTFVSKTETIEGVEYLYVLVRHASGDALVEQVFGDLVREITNQIETFEVRRSAKQKPKAVQDLAHLVQLAQNVGKSSNLTQLAMHLVNDLSKSTGADRVCFFRPSGKLLAVSGVSQASLKTSLAKNLSRIARIAKSSGQPIESTDNQVVFGNMRRGKLVKKLFEQVESEIVYVSPIQEEKKCCGMVSLEFFDRSSLGKEWVDQRNLISQSLGFIAPVVHRAVQIQSIPGIRVFDFVFNHLLTRPARVLLWLASLSAIMLVAIYFLVFVQRPFEIHAEGYLQPTVKRNVFAPREGEIKTLFVAEGTNVDVGQKLALIESKDLLDQLIVVEGELAEVTEELESLAVTDLKLQYSDSDDATDAQTRTASEIERLKAKSLTLVKRQALLTKQAEELLLVSPICGQVTTRDVNRRLDSRPVDRGDLLMAISAMDGEWEIELEVPDNRIEFIRNAKQSKVRFRIAADSEQLYEGTIRELDFRAIPTESETEAVVQARVDFDETELNNNLRIGSRVIAKIDCGKRSNLFLLTYEFRNKIREWFFY